MSENGRGLFPLLGWEGKRQTINGASRALAGPAGAMICASTLVPPRAMLSRQWAKTDVRVTTRGRESFGQIGSTLSH